jgi:CHAD domain-containing protein
MSETSFQLRADQSLNESVRRVMREQLQAALGWLAASPDVPLDQRVHEVRKALKRLRATLRLVRSAIGESVYQLENSSLRNAARPLSQVRDSKILLDAFEELGESLPENAQKTFSKTGELLAAQRQQLLSDAKREDELLFNCRASLQAAYARLELWPLIPERWRDVRRGLRQVYRRGRKGFRRSLTDSTPAQLHDWRKQAKYLRHQLELLSAIDSQKLNQTTEQAAELAALLGRDHDLFLLGERLHSCLSGPSDALVLDLLVAALEQRRFELQRQALSIARELYRRRPKRFARRVGRLWKSWRRVES